MLVLTSASSNLDKLNVLCSFFIHAMYIEECDLAV